MFCRFCNERLSTGYGTLPITPNELCQCGKHPGCYYQIINCPCCGKYDMYIEPNDNEMNQRIRDYQHYASEKNKAATEENCRMLWIDNTIDLCFDAQDLKHRINDFTPLIIEGL